MNNWVEKEIEIGAVDDLLKEGYEVEVYSPDGWVGINFFVDKGSYEEYIITTANGLEVKCNADHLFKSVDDEWITAQELEYMQDPVELVTIHGPSLAFTIKTDNIIPIVDINVNHKNKRYYTNGIESHNTGAGKSLAMCHMAAGNLMDNKSVLYITLEMAEEKIAERIDANLLNITMDDLDKTPKAYYDKMIAKLKSRTMGKLIIKEYPTSTAHANHFRHLLNELKIKKNFIPDIIYIDYINLCGSVRIKAGANANSYTMIKSIAEELRGLAVEHNVPIISATQVTRAGYGSSDIEITDTSECIFQDEMIELRDGSSKMIKDIVVGDQIISNDQYKTVHMVHHSKLKDCYKIKTSAGKEIIVSKDHVFPTKRGRISIETGLSVGDNLNSRNRDE